jgi:LysM repeat protein
MADKKQKAKETSKNLDLKDYQEKLVEWYESDSAKAVATVIAILLIPGAVLAWNYFNDHDFTRGGKISEEASYTSVYDELEPKPDFTEIFQSNPNEAIVDVTVTPSITPSPTPTPTPSISVSPTPSPTPVQSVVKRPSTVKKPIYYRVRKGDSYYSISRKFCRNDYFYRINRTKNHLMTGTVLKVVCR